MVKQLITLLSLSLLFTAMPGALRAGPLESQVEDAAARADRAKDATEKLRADKPAVYKREALRRFRDALERAERREEKAALKASGTARHADRDARRAANRNRKRMARQKRQARKERNERRRRDINATNPR